MKDGASVRMPPYPISLDRKQTQWTAFTMETYAFDQAISAQLEKLIEPARPFFEHHARQEQLGIWLERPVFDFEDMTLPLVEALKSHPLLINGHGDFFAGKQLARHVETSCVYALMKVANDAGALAALAWFHKVACIKNASLRYVLEIRGLMISNRISFSNGVHLSPWDEMPDSPNVRAITNAQVPRPGSHHAHVSSLAAYIEVSDVPGRAAHGEPSGSPAADLATETLHRTARALALSGELAPVLGISWIDFIDADLARLDFGRMWHGDPTDASVIGSLAPEIDSVAIAWVNRFLAADRAVQCACDIPLERLTMGRTRKSGGNKAIDGAICLEALLGGKSQGDLTHKLATRAAILLGGTLEERRATQRQIRDFYGLRSRIVHGNTSEIKPKDRENVYKGLEICERVLQRVVAMNRIPCPEDWDLMGNAEQG
jgi:hypothetical protein